MRSGGLLARSTNFLRDDCAGEAFFFLEIQMNIVSKDGKKTMSSLEVAELTGKQHKHVLTDIRKMLTELEIDSARFSAEYIDSTGRSMPHYELPHTYIKTLVTGYDVKRRHKVILRLEELEANAVPKDLPSALRAYADELEQKQRLQLELQQTEVKVARLEITLDRAELHASVKKMEARYSRNFAWQPLKEYSLTHGYEMPKVFDQNYERGVNSYHDDVWMAVYKVTTRTQKVLDK